MNVKIEILRLLESRVGVLTPEQHLVRDIALVTGQPLSTAEVKDVLEELRGKRYIAGVTPDLGGPSKWRITDEGRAAFQNAI